MTKIQSIPERYLKPWLRGKVYLYPIAGLAMLLYVSCIFPFAALWELRGELVSAYKDCIALTLCKVEGGKDD